MSQRPGFLVNHFVKADGRWALTRSPNQQADVITVEIRCHWPHPAPKDEIRRALVDLVDKALDKLDERFPDEPTDL